MKMVNDLSQYKNILPYASETFGVYQPMLGWRSKRTSDRISRAFALDRRSQYAALHQKFRSQFEIVLDDDGAMQAVRNVAPASLRSGGSDGRSFVVEAVAKALPTPDRYDDSVWDGLLTKKKMQDTLTKVVVPRTTEWYQRELRGRGGREQGEDLNALMADQLDRESRAAGYLLHLNETKQYEKLKSLFFKADGALARLTHLLSFKDPLELFDPFKDIDRVGLSPIGIVHLFRQYFFELDTFLGTPVEHVWLSPGSSVELIEVSTRSTLVERTMETALETTIRTEKSTTEEDEISEAVKEDNKSEIKFGANATVNQSWVSGSASASASIDVGNTQSKAREVTHRHMRQQTDKLSTEIRKNFKSTFRTVTESTDMTSKRYLLANTTEKLLNYELRRKMRQVGVQVQDIGTYLCWQTYVDDPGRVLGIAKLVHMAKSPDPAATPPPEAIPFPQAVVTELPIDIPFVQVGESVSELDETYADGEEVDEEVADDDKEKIQWEFPGYVALCNQTGYAFERIDFDYQGADTIIESTSETEEPKGTVKFGIKVRHINFKGNSPIRVLAKISWLPEKSLIDEVTAKNEANVNAFNEKTKYEQEKAFVDAARERIKLASNIEPRPFHELREEERIVVYRRLVQDMLTKDLPMPDERTHHVVSELLNAIFDIDKMLYFVAPEWWRPRLHVSHPSLGGIRATPGSTVTATSTASAAKTTSIHAKLAAEATKNLITQKVSTGTKKVGAGSTPISADDTVSWGGANEARDNYFITEESAPAPLGSSLGWLLQLDGDPMRNAFLNAPWVKAVIPIRPGKERAAMNWLERLHVEGTDGLDDRYIAPAAELAKIPHQGANVTIRDAVLHLCDVVADKHEKALKVAKYPGDEIDDANRVSATPIDRVYEHGFYPLQGGFRVAGDDFEVFDQWVEVLPTDQVVPVEVTYDPKTGRQI